MKIKSSLVKKVFEAFCIIALLVFLSPVSVFAATNYGDGTYGGGNYNEGDVAVSNNTGNSNTTAGSTTEAPHCNAAVTQATPDLFEVRTNKNSATLFFAPPGGSYASFYIAYSRDPNTWEYGTEYNQGQSTGALQYTINALQPNTKYYIKIRAGNGCATGKWSNTMMITTSSSTNKKVFYKNVFTAIIQTVKSVVSKVTQTPSQTSQPTVTNQPQVTTKPVTTQPTAKKFCILWWCF